jgi:GT2 family glycosyltransferase
MSVSAIVVSHGHAAELEHSLAALAAQVDDVVVIANLPGSVRRLPPAVRVIQNSQPRPLAANVNTGIGATSGDYVLFSNPDAVPEEGAVAALAAFMESHPQCGIAGPRITWPDGTWQPSRRRFPTVAGTIVRRTPLRRLFPPYERQRGHYQLDELPTEPVESDWMLGAFLLQRRTMLEEIGGWDAGYRHYVEDIDLCYRAMRAGWERWYVPAASVTHAYAAVIDKKFLSRHTLWHARGMARFARKHPEALLGRGREAQFSRRAA